MAIYLKNIRYIDWQTFAIRQGNLKIEEGLNGSVSFVDIYPDTAVDCQNKLVTRAFACGHHHAYSALATGMPAPQKTPKNFHEILKYIWWNLDKKLDAEIIRACALVTAMNCAKNGVTFVIDHHASPYAIEGSLEIISEAFEQVGIQRLLCYEISDRDGQKIADAGLKETENYLQAHQGLVGLHASFTVKNDTIKLAVKLSEKFNSGIHIHVAEDPVDQEFCLREHKCRVIQRLQHNGVLQFPKTILAHAIHLDETERKILSASPAWIAINTESNLNNEVGLFSARGLNEKQIMLGTDGMHSDMIRSAQFHYFSHKKHESLSVLQAYQRLRQVHEYLSQIGFSADGENNLIIFDYNPPTPVTSENWLGHFFYGLNSSHINSVISNGEWVIRDSKLCTINEDDILHFANEQTRRLWNKLTTDNT